MLMGFLPQVSTAPGRDPMSQLRPEDFGQKSREGAPIASEDQWTEPEIVRGREECMHLLPSIAAEVEILAPIKRGGCGVLAPVRLNSLGSSSKVVFVPPVEVNCRMMAALYRWVRTTLQPAARDRLGSPVARIVGASGYSCRNVYNLPDGHLSQHAFANAIDIPEFGLKDGRSVTVLTGWGPTARDIRAQTKARSESARSKLFAAGVGANTTSKPNLPASGRDLTVATLIPLKKAPEPERALIADQPPTPESEVAAVKPTAATKFLKILRRGACLQFEAVLGPEANDAHRNHFHFGLVSGRSDAYCE